jgi:hypothetical protein
MPRGGCWGCSPPGKFRREKYQRGDQGKNRQKLTPPPGKFRPEKISKGKFNPPSNFGNFQLAPPWREVVWAFLLLILFNDMKIMNSFQWKKVQNHFNNIFHDCSLYYIQQSSN